MSKTNQITFTVNDQTLEAINELKAELNVDTTAAVLRRALALTRVATQNADEEDHTLTIIDKKNERQKILLTG